VTERFASKFNLGDAARGYVPGDGVPGLPDWECIPTPGHTPGHVAFFRKSDRVLITGDACLTVDIDSFWGLLRNKQSIARPPSVATWNWQAAKASVAALARFEPSVLACGHGIPMMGAETARDLVAFADHFSRSAMKSTSNCAP
jgi:glyoxylase-like metal-dependent hydrolase (beta-lactamase superfamily II)